MHGCAQVPEGLPRPSHPAPLPLIQLPRTVHRLKALLSQWEPSVAAYTNVLRHSGIPCTLPLITKLVSKYNKSGQWRCGLALCWSLPAIGLEVRLILPWGPPPPPPSYTPPSEIPAARTLECRPLARRSS